MKIFASNRLAYFEDLAEDPDVQKSMKASEALSRFIGALDGLDSDGDTMYIKGMIRSIPELNQKASNKIEPSNGGYLKWMRVYHPVNGKSEIVNMGDNYSLATEQHVGRSSFWDTKTKRIIMISNSIVNRFSDIGFKQDFMEKLAEAIDTNSSEIVL